MDNKELDVLFYGMTIVDYLFILKCFPKKYQINRTEKKIKKLGGSATNSATCTSSWGLKTGLFGCHYLGNDTESDFFSREIEQYKNIDTSMLKIDNTENTQCAYIFIDNTGERTILADVSPQKYQDILIEYLQTTKLLCVDGKFANSSPYMKNAVLMANKENIPVILSDTDYQEQHFAFAHIVLNSTKTTELKLDQLKKTLLRRYKKYTSKIIIHTLGSLGCLVITNNECTHFPLANNQNAIIQDTTGAGDTFRAGIVYGYLKGWGIEKSIAFAMFAGTKACSYYGGSANSAFSWVDDFINFQKNN